MLGLLGALWGVTGIMMLLGSAVYRLSFLATEAFSSHFQWYHWIALFVICIFMAYAEGYRGFQQRFSPRVAARALYLKSHPGVTLLVFAPFFCMGYFHATRRRKITSISLTAGIIGLVMMVRLIPQPWRGIIDAGVVLGLIWGLVSLFVFCLRAFSSRNFPYSPEVPEA